MNSEQRSIDWDFKFSPPNVYEVDIVPLKVAFKSCVDCGDPARHRVAMELRSGGWSTYDILCGRCIYKRYEVEPND